MLITTQIVETIIHKIIANVKDIMIQILVSYYHQNVKVILIQILVLYYHQIVKVIKSDSQGYRHSGPNN